VLDKKGYDGLIPIFREGFGGISEELLKMKKNRACPIAVGFVPILMAFVFSFAVFPNQVRGSGISDQPGGSLSPQEALRRAKEADKRKDYKEARKMYELSAEGGFAEGQYDQAANLYGTVIAGNLGGMWITEGTAKAKWNKEVEEAREKGLDWLRKSAAQGYAPAELEMGKLYAGKGQGDFYEAFGLGHDGGKAKQWFEKAAAQGNAEAKEYWADLNAGIKPAYKGEFSDLTNQTTPGATATPNPSQAPKGPGSPDTLKGLEAQKAGHLNKALGLFKKAAVSGDDQAEAALGWLYCEGKNFKKHNYVLAQKWFQKAADQGDGSGECGMGQIYLSGLGTKSDYAQAVQWFQKSADHGDPRGQYTLATCHHFGYGLPKDDDKAYHWLQISAAQDYQPAKDLLKVVEDNYKKAHPPSAVTPENPEDDLVKDGGAALLKKAVEADNADRHEEAVEYYKRSAKQGNAQAEGQLSLEYFSDRGQGSDYEKAVEWAKKSVAQGNRVGEFILADCYLGGHGIAEDDAKGLDLMRKSADQGWFQAQYDLGAFYEYGRFLTKDLSKAKYWYQLSAAQGYASAQNALKYLGDGAAGSGGNAPNTRSTDNNSNGNVSAEEAVKNGDYYQEPNSGHEDMDKAKEWYSYAAKMGNADAEYKLGHWYDAECNPLLTEPENPKYDCAQAVYWFQLAANQGNKAAADEVQKYHQSGW